MTPADAEVERARYVEATRMRVLAKTALRLAEGMRLGPEQLDPLREQLVDARRVERAWQQAFTAADLATRERAA